MAIINGDANSNTLMGDINGVPEADVLIGLGGNDNLFGFSGAGSTDMVDGGYGADHSLIAGIDHSVIGGDNNDNILIGTADNDLFYAHGGNDRLKGLGGNDALLGGAGDDIMAGGVGADHLDGYTGIDTAEYLDSWTGVFVDLAGGKGGYGTAAGDTLSGVENVNGSGFDDTLIGNAVANVLIGFDGTDRLDGGGGNDTLYGLQGNDYLTGGGGADVLHGAIGVDTAIYTASAGAVLVDLAAGQGYNNDAAGDTLYDVENIDGTDFGDLLYGDGNANVLNGRAGADALFGGGGDDSLWGGAGNDIMGGDAGADVLDGESGINTVSYNGSTSVGVNLTTGYGTGGEAEGDRLFHFAIAEGSQFGDTLTGDAYVNVLTGLGGSDTLSGSGGDDILDGSSDGDRLDGGSGADLLNGGLGTDTAAYASATAGVTADLANASANTGDAAGDIYSAIESLAGSAFADILRGNNSANRLMGGVGGDTMSGSGGNDVLVGSAGRDAMTGGAQADTFDFDAVTDSGTTATTRDVVTDFVHLTDKLDLSTIDAIQGGGTSNDAFDFIGTGAFTAAGQVRAVQSGSHTVLELNTSGTGGAESTIQLSNFTAGTLTDADFLA